MSAEQLQILTVAGARIDCSDCSGVDPVQDVAAQLSPSALIKEKVVASVLLLEGHFISILWVL